MSETNDNSGSRLYIPRRKPVPLRSVRSTPILRQHEDAGIVPPKYEDLFHIDHYDVSSSVRGKAAPQVVEPAPDGDFEKQLKNLVLVTEDEDFHSQALASGRLPPADGKQAVRRLDDIKSAVGTAFGDAQHFVGGLLPRPFEATKHHAILRHSLGLVYYRGLSTSVTITVFSDEPIPSSRQLWLQRRGYSGQVGLVMGAAIGTRSSWIDVTPEREICANEFPMSSARAWERDVAKFSKKAKASKSLRHHLPRETLVLHIPSDCEDGYFRVVLCNGREVLCPSPIFRYASTSCDPSILRGASLRTLPLELGIKAAAMVVEKVVATASYKTLGPTATVAQGMMNRSDHDIPMHRLGIRSEASMSQKDQIGTGGMYWRH